MTYIKQIFQLKIYSQQIFFQTFRTSTANFGLFFMTCFFSLYQKSFRKVAISACHIVVSKPSSTILCSILSISYIKEKAAPERIIPILHSINSSTLDLQSLASFSLQINSCLIQAVLLLCLLFSRYAGRNILISQLSFIASIITHVFWVSISYAQTPSH